MKQDCVFHKVLIFSFWLVVSSLLVLDPVAVVIGQNADDDGMEVLTQGPIHEAFAEVSVNETEPAVVTRHSVPSPIEEIPPDLRPEGDNVEWISGYWSFDEDRDDFIWVSGVWRDIPPGRQWIPGYWIQADGGDQYISGFWAAEDQAETEYFPSPPEPLETGPNAPETSPYQVWTTGNWVWIGDHYVWQPGYWVETRPDLVWIPAHYVWTPRGYIYVQGYWDYQMDRRGVMFAPVSYTRPVYTHHNYHYTPTIVLDFDAIFLSLFIRFESRHYYYGDYYDNRYKRRGYHPWYSQHATRYGYDPYYRSHRSHHSRHDRHWETNNHREYEYRRNHKEARPPRTYALQTHFNTNRPHVSMNNVIGRRLTDVAKRPHKSVRFTHVSADHKKKMQSRNRDLIKVKAERRTLEMAPKVRGKPQKHTEMKSPVRVKLPKSPITSKRGRKLENGNPRTAPSEKPDVKPRKSQDQSQIKPLGKPQKKHDVKSKGKPGVKPAAKSQKKQKDQPQTKPQKKPQKKQDIKSKGKPGVKPAAKSKKKQKDQPQAKPKGKVQKKKKVVDPEDTPVPDEDAKKKKGKNPIKG